MNSLSRNIPPVTLNLVAINVLIWLACTFAPSLDASLSRLCGLHYFLSPDYHFWQPLTYMFIHAGFSHLFFNMFGVVMFGAIVERVLGSARYLLFYLAAGIGAAFIQEGVYAVWIANLKSALPPDITLTEIATQSSELFRHDLSRYIFTISNIFQIINTPTVGASGALFGVLLAFGMIFPNMPMYIMFIPVPIKAKWLVLGYGAIELFLGVTGLQQGVAHFAHLGGMLIGFILILYWRKKGEINSGPLY